MKASSLVIAAFTYLLASCATVGPAPVETDARNNAFYRWSMVYGRHWTAPNPNYPKISVLNDAYIIVDQEPIYIKQLEENAIWFVVDPYSPYYFVEHDGIRFDNPKPVQLRCTRQADNWRLVICTYKKTNRAKYPYQITLTNGTNTIRSDPSVMND